MFSFVQVHVYIKLLAVAYILPDSCKHEIAIEVQYELLFSSFLKWQYMQESWSILRLTIHNTPSLSYSSSHLLTHQREIPVHASNLFWRSNPLFLSLKIIIFPSLYIFVNFYPFPVKRKSSYQFCDNARLVIVWALTEDDCGPLMYLDYKDEMASRCRLNKETRGVSRQYAYYH